MAHRNHKPLWVFQHIPIVLVGAALIWFGFKVAEAPPALKRLVDDEPLRSIADALLVAGILTVVVDPFIKGHLYREVATGTFEYLLGFAQPREIQEAMRKLAFETTVYARNLKMNYVIERLNQHSVRLNVETAVRIENPSAQVQFYEPHLLFEEAENPTVNYIEVSSKEGTRRHDSGLRAEVGKPEVFVMPHQRGPAVARRIDSRRIQILRCAARSFFFRTPLWDSDDWR